MGDERITPTVRLDCPINITETTADTRKMYRLLRKAGFARDVANYLTAGVIIGAQAGGQVSFGPITAHVPSGSSTGGDR